MAVKRVPVSVMANGAELALYLHEYSGNSGDGPTVGIAASIHGDEFAGTQIVMELADLLSKEELRGRLLLLPVANPLAFGAGRRATPDPYRDPKNLNRTFPGNPDGSFTEQLANVLAEQFFAKLDVLIDIHTGGYTTVDYTYIHGDEKLSSSFGSRVLYRAPSEVGIGSDSLKGGASGLAGRSGINVVTLEIGGGMVDQKPYVKRGVEGVLNMLRTLKVIEGEPKIHSNQAYIDKITVIRTHNGGFIECDAVELCTKLEDNELLGRVVNPYTFETIETFRNPIPGGILLLSHLTTDIVRPGDDAFLIGIPEK